ncbi:MAG TPA: c-type cytochrome [Burkholderiales bacterium]|nr:c-type cytochrome [Burkholderiales bacterium]
MNIVFGAFLFALVFTAGTALAQPAGGDVARGAVKAAACGACHGTPKTAPLAGMPAVAEQQAEFLVLQMFLLREGLRDVPQMAGMLNGWSDADLNDVAAWFAAQALPPPTTKPNDKLHAQGARLAQTLGCGSCHLGNYRGQRQVPRIAGQQEDYLAAALKAYRDNQRSGIDTSMNAVMYKVPDSDIQALAHYLAHQK